MVLNLLTGLPPILRYLFFNEISSFAPDYWLRIVFKWLGHPIFIYNRYFFSTNHFFREGSIFFSNFRDKCEKLKLRTKTINFNFGIDKTYKKHGVKNKNEKKKRKKGRWKWKEKRTIIENWNLKLVSKRYLENRENIYECGFEVETQKHVLRIS